MREPVDYDETADGIRENLILDDDEYELSSGKESRFYVNIKGMGEHPVLNMSITELARQYVQELDYDSIAGEGKGGAVTVPSLATLNGDRYTLLRDEEKDYGREEAWEGADPEGRDILFVDDVVTTGGSAIEGIERLEDLGGNPVAFLTYVDRQEGGMENIAETGVETHALFEKDDILE